MRLERRTSPSTSPRRGVVASAALTIVVLGIVAACSGPDDSPSARQTETPPESGSTNIAEVQPSGTAVTVESTGTSDGLPTITTSGTETSVAPSMTPDQSPMMSPTATTPSQIEPSPSATVARAPTYAAGSVQPAIVEVGSGFTDPDYVTHAGDGSGRVFVLEKAGRVRLLNGDPYLDITDRVNSPDLDTDEHEMGLYGLAFHPRFEENRYFYVHYNDLSGLHIISRFTEGADGSVDPGTEKVLLTQEQPEKNFNGGMLTFGPDGYLYIGFGTGGQSPHLHLNPQDFGTFLGKILRIDVDNGDPYAIPPDNPFITQEGALQEIWAYGLRNPYRFTFDSVTGDLYLGSPGQFQWEWLNYRPAGEQGGENYGWPMFEGSSCWELWDGPCDPTGIEMPIYERTTYSEGNCVIIGGNVYRGTTSPSLQGAYFFGDYCSGRVWTLGRDAAGAWAANEAFVLPGGAAGGGRVGSFGEDEAGEVYVTDINNGIIYRITASPPL